MATPSLCRLFQLSGVREGGQEVRGKNQGWAMAACWAASCSLTFKGSPYDFLTYPRSYMAEIKNQQSAPCWMLFTLHFT